MTDLDLLSDFLVFLYAIKGDRKKSGAALEVEPESGEEHCPECDEEE